MDPKDFARLANNFYNTKGLDCSPDRLRQDIELSNYLIAHQDDVKRKFKVAFVFICLNPLYWQYASEMVLGAKEYFLPGHNTDFFFWTDIPEDSLEINKRLFAGVNNALFNKGIKEIDINSVYKVTEDLVNLRKRTDVNIIPTESVSWPYPTLLRYNLFLQQEDKLKDYDYIFYLDIDMQFCQVVGDEILPREGLMAAQHPMYALKKEYYPPYEANPRSSAYINLPGKLVNDPTANTPEKIRFQPLYYAGGFQGGRADKFIEAMKECRKKIDGDMTINYIARWNDESYWNRYLQDNPPEVVLSPSYIYPDSLINEIYIPLWGRDYIPKIKTLTKWFTTSKEGGEAVKQIIEQNKI